MNEKIKDETYDNTIFYNTDKPQSDRTDYRAAFIYSKLRTGIYLQRARSVFKGCYML